MTAQNRVTDERDVLHVHRLDQETAGDLRAETDRAAGPDDAVITHQRASRDHRPGADHNRADDMRARLDLSARLGKDPTS